MKMPDKKGRKRINLWFTIMSMVLVIFFSYMAGYHFSAGEMADGVLNLILITFWLGFFAIQVADHRLDVELESLHREKKVIEKYAEGLDELATLIEEAEKQGKSPKESVLEHAETGHRSLLKKALMETMTEVIGEGMPTQAECEVVAARFKELTGHSVKLSVDENGIDVEIDEDNHGLLDKNSEQTQLPLDKKPATKIAVKGGSSKGTKVPVRKKKLTKKKD